MELILKYLPTGQPCIKFLRLGNTSLSNRWYFVESAMLYSVRTTEYSKVLGGTIPYHENIN